MYNQFITPVTTKLSFTNASDPQKLTNPISTISFYSNNNNTLPTVENVSYNVQKTFPISDSWNDNLLKAPIYFDYPTPPNPSVERTSLITFNNSQDNFRLKNIPNPTYHSTSTSYDLSINSPVYCPKSPVYRPKSPGYSTKSYDTPQKISIESPIFCPSSPTTPINYPKVHNNSINSPQYYQHQILNGSLEFHASSPINVSTINEFKRTTLSEKKRNSIEQSNSIGKIKYNKVHNDEKENKENSLGEAFKTNNESIDVISVDENTSAESIQAVNSDSDITTDVNQTPVKSTNLSNESSKRGKKGLIRRSNRLAVKPPLNYRV
ncbi:hypothetical protein GLOIN_2v1709383 [Rhizophagus clarus]|nr:hypothetical protein GLOIN_2v1709383 [Rhizophagus clarus]